MNKRRVVVTGLGAVCPVGLDVTESWESVLNGKSGIGPIEHFDVSDFSTRFGGSVKNFDITRYVSEKEAKKMDVFIHYGLAAGSQAFED
ncbi:MAG: 3-oxoacyl-ACP synthase, partial [Proteobacteria bacterium]|nr:3-oxoacyl-ACP synthase [Pseudomonadota bacterium]